MPDHFYNNKKVEYIIYNGIALTMNLQKAIIHDAALAIDKGIIVALDTTENIKKLYSADSEINAQGLIIMPGLINGHTHAAMAILRGIADDQPLQEWLKKIWETEKKFVNSNFVYWGALLACCEMLKSGITTFVDMYFYSKDTARAAALAGMRAIIAETIMDSSTPGASTPDQAYKYVRSFIEEWQTNEIITPAVAPHSLYACSLKTINESNELANFYQKPLLMHVSETKKEVADCLKKYHTRPIEYLYQNNIVSSNLIAAHCVHVDEKEIRLLSQAKAGVIYNPQSNLKLGSGVAPIDMMYGYGVNIGLGTDSAASNNTLDLWQEIKTGLILQKTFTRESEPIDAYTILEMATIKGAQAIGKADQIGSLEIGKKADLILVDHENPHQIPNKNYYSLLAYSTKAADVNFVMINGKIIMKNKVLVSLNGLSEETIINEVKKLRKAIG